MKQSLLCLVFVLGCGATAGSVALTDAWPATPPDYGDTTATWTRSATLNTGYQEALELAATFKSPEWRAAYAARDAKNRGLTGAAFDQRMAQAQADAAGPYEFELLVTTWDRRENDLDRGKRSVWRVRVLDEQGMEVEPLEIVRDKRSEGVLKSEFPAFGKFSIAYIARFPREKALLGPDVKQLRLHMSSSRGHVQLVWKSGN
ncbi:MAG: hypothetical protein H0T89_32140 [Deltaproteobacteria bacterium]|nr:hypothetical protein [Deltaproteobacteria bacterium]